MSASTVFDLELIGGAGERGFVARVGDGAGGWLAEEPFEWRVDSTALALNLGELQRAAVSGETPAGAVHEPLGRQLFDAAFPGRVGELWRARVAEARPHRRRVRLVLTIDPMSARPLLNLPWEYLHDGRGFLALQATTPVFRRPFGVPAVSLEPLTEPLRLLIAIAAPLGLSQNEVLDTAREEDLLLEATAEARRLGTLEVEFTRAGSLVAIEEALRDFDPHLFHLTGHGVFDPEKDRGHLLLETADGRKRPVENGEFATLLERTARSLRLVFLSACQSAVAARGEGFTDLGPRLLEAGFPAVVAMGSSVLNVSAMALGSAFYAGLAAGRQVDEAMTEARGRLATAGPNRVDFGVPVLYLADPGCLTVAALPARAGDDDRGPAQDLTGITRAQRFVGRAAEVRYLRAGLDPTGGPWRGAVIHGLGGMGKTVLATRLAERMASRFRGILTIRLSPTTTARDVFERFGAFFRVHRLRLPHPGVEGFLAALEQPLPLAAKAGALAEILSGLPLLVIFDNCEDVLAEGRPVSKGARDAAEVSSADLAVRELFGSLVGAVTGPSRFLFTSRVDFDPLPSGRASNAVGHLDLGELGFRDAVYLMETLPPLDALPVALLPRRGEEPAPRGHSKRGVWERLGGHPYSLALFAEHARRRSVGEVLSDLSGVRRELLEQTLLDQAVAALPPRAAELIRRAAVYEQPVPAEGLAFQLGDDKDAMPEVTDEIAALLSWGLLARPPGSDEYAVHALVKDWVRAGWGEEERKERLRRAAKYWLAVGEDSSSLEPELNARHYFFEAGDYEEAADLVHFATELLLRWGEVGYLLRLLDETIPTINGRRKIATLGNRALVYQSLGEVAKAKRDHQAVLAEFRAGGDLRGTAQALHNLGIVHGSQGEYPQSRKCYEEALEIWTRLGDHSGRASILHHLGTLRQFQGDLSLARRYYEESLEISQNLGEDHKIAGTLMNLGTVLRLQGNLEPARNFLQQSLAIQQEIGDRVGIGQCFHELGVIFQLRGEYPAARVRFEQSLEIMRTVGHQAAVAASLHQLGYLCQLQEDYVAARDYYLQSLEISVRIGDQLARAGSILNLGVLSQFQSRFSEAQENYQESLNINRRLGNQSGLALSLHQLGTLREAEGSQAAAVPLVAKALQIFDRLGSPDREIARATLTRLRATLGDEAFEAALNTPRPSAIEETENP
jgi:tetratricopeptide (TPR) repeat protein